MAIPATNQGGSKYEPIPAGTYAARCYSMIHIGTIPTQFKGKEKLQNKVRISWELPTELKIFKEENGEQPYSVSKEYTLSMYEKSTLRKHLESWRGKAFSDAEAESFDVTKLLGVPCMISIVHKEVDGKTYADIASVTTVPKGMTVPDQINPTFEFNFTPLDMDKFNSLPEWLRKKIENSEEFKHYADQMHGEDEFQKQINLEQDNDGLPF